MPVAKLEFQLPEEQVEFDLCTKAPALLAAVEDYLRTLRDKLKHGELTEAEHSAYDAARALFFQCLADHDADTLF